MTLTPTPSQGSYARVKRLVTGFVALQDVEMDMGPTLIVPGKVMVDKLCPDMVIIYI